MKLVELNYFSFHTYVNPRTNDLTWNQHRSSHYLAIPLTMSKILPDIIYGIPGNLFFSPKPIIQICKPIPEHLVSHSLRRGTTMPACHMLKHKVIWHHNARIYIVRIRSEGGGVEEKVHIFVTPFHRHVKTITTQWYCAELFAIWLH